MSVFLSLSNCEWIYLQCVVPDYCTLFAPLENFVFFSFLPAIFGCEVSPLKFELILVVLGFPFLNIQLSLSMMLQLIALWIPFRDLLVMQGRIEGGFWGFRKPLLIAKHFYNSLPQ